MGAQATIDTRSLTLVYNIFLDVNCLYPLDSIHSQLYKHCLRSLAIANLSDKLYRQEAKASISNRQITVQVRFKSNRRKASSRLLGYFLSHSNS